MNMKCTNCNADYINWNIAGASRMLKHRPEEAAITLAVYNLHKEVLRARGVTDSEFYDADRIIEGIVKQYQDSD